MQQQIRKEIGAVIALTLVASAVFYVALARLGSLESDGAQLLVFGLM